MLLFVANSNPCVKILTPNLSFEEQKAIILADPRAVTRILGHPPDELVAIALRKDPTLSGMLSQTFFSKSNLVRLCPFVMFLFVRSWRTEDLAIIAIDSLKQSGNAAEAVEWLTQLRNTIDWDFAEPVDITKYFFKVFPALEESFGRDM